MSSLDLALSRGLRILNTRDFRPTLLTCFRASAKSAVLGSSQLLMFVARCWIAEVTVEKAPGRVYMVPGEGVPLEPQALEDLDGSTIWM